MVGNPPLYERLPQAVQDLNSNGISAVSGSGKWNPRTELRYGSWKCVLDAIYLSNYYGFLREYRWVLPTLLLSSAILYEVSASFIMSVIGNFYLAVSSQDLSLFLETLWKSLVVVILVCFFKAFRDFLSEACALQWRCNMTHAIHNIYLRECLPYHVNNGHLRIDNPDQRIVSDANCFASSLGEVVQKSIVVPGILVYYTWYLFSLFGWVAPAVCYVYFFLGASINSCFLKRIVPLEYQYEKLEGTFRYSHAQVRLRSESIAFFGSSAFRLTEKQKLTNIFSQTVGAKRKVILAHLPLYCGVQFFNYFGSVVNYAAVGASIFFLLKTKKLPESDIASLLAQGSYSCLYIINAFSTGFETFEALTRIKASANRVMELLYICGFHRVGIHGGAEELYPKTVDGCEVPSNFDTEIDEEPCTDPASDELLILNDVTVSIRFPQDITSSRELIKNLTFSLRKGQHLLVSGPSGIGKTSLLRVIAGLWEPESGFIVVNGTRFTYTCLTPRLLMCLPQNPYVFEGSLMEQVLYPFSFINYENGDDKLLPQVLEILSALKLDQLFHSSIYDECGGNELYSKLKNVRQWDTILSPGEQQRIGFARVLFHKPKIVLLDESTSALNEEIEEEIMELIEHKGITMISVGHRKSLRKYHKLELKIFGNGYEMWELNPILQ